MAAGGTGGGVGGRQSTAQHVPTHLAELSIMTEGRTGGGGTGTFCRIIQSGRTTLVRKPMASQSSSEIRFRISRAFQAGSSCSTHGQQRVLKSMQGSRITSAPSRTHAYEAAAAHQQLLN